jgi:hypothetical protein
MNRLQISNLQQQHKDNHLQHNLPQQQNHHNQHQHQQDKDKQKIGLSVNPPLVS